MTFEEFFKKKKISLGLLQNSEPALFTEFKNHFEQMGEKSFDHTKKYWFNPLRRKYPLPPEIKIAKVVIENPIAEQTITESLTEQAAPAPSVGFKPRFKAGVTTKPAGEQPKPETEKPAEAPNTEETQSAPAVGFKPRFKANMVQKPKEEQKAAGSEPETPANDEAKPKPAVGFKPRFKASMVQKSAEDKIETAIEKPDEVAESDPPAEPSAETPKATPALGFKPKFRAATPSKPAQETPQPAEPEVKPEEPITEKPADPAAKPMGFKPRFNAAKMKPKSPDEGAD